MLGARQHRTRDLGVLALLAAYGVRASRGAPLPAHDQDAAPPIID